MLKRVEAYDSIEAVVREGQWLSRCHKVCRFDFRVDVDRFNRQSFWKQRKVAGIATATHVEHATGKT